MPRLDPLVSEFTTIDEADAYDLWFREQVEAALASNKPRVAHDVVKARTRAILEKHRDARSDLGS